MDIASKLLQPFLLRHAEMLFFIDNQQTEMIETDGFRQQRMRSDHHLHLARGKVGAKLFCRRRLRHPRKNAKLDRKSGKPFGEDAAMLARQKRCRRNKRHLIAGHRGDEGGAQGHLGLAKADVTADQPVRRLAGGQIADNILDRPHLVLGLGKAEAGAEFGKAAGGGVQWLGAGCHPLCRNLDQRIGHFTHAALDAGHPRLPRRTAEPVKLGVGACAAIARQHLDILHRQIQLVSAGIDKLQAVMRATRGIDDHQPFIASDAMFGMDHQIAFLKRADLAQKILTTATAGTRT